MNINLVRIYFDKIKTTIGTVMKSFGVSSTEMHHNWENNQKSKMMSLRKSSKAKKTLYTSLNFKLKFCLITF